MHTRTGRFGKAAVCAIFAVFCLLPAANWATNLVDLGGLGEGKGKTPPSFTELVKSGNGLEELSKHFNTTFSLRPLFVRLKNQLDFTLFRESKQVVLGEDGWLCDLELAQRYIPTTDNLSGEQWGAVEKRLLALKAFLDARGVKLLVVPVPLKPTVYGERFPGISRKRPSTDGYSHFIGLLNACGMEHIDVRRLLTDNKGRGNVYFKTDMHSSYVAALRVSQEIVSRANTLMGTNVPWNDAFAPGAQVDFVGGEAASLGVFFPPGEKIVSVTEQASGGAPCRQTLPHPTFSDYKIFKSGDGCAQELLPKSALFGNSFMLYCTGLVDHFTEIHRVLDYSNFQNLSKIIEKDTKLLIWMPFEIEFGYQLLDKSFNYWDLSVINE